MPKNYDPDVPPDPERWLPRHERSGFRKKRDRRNRDAAMKGTQGAATGASDLQYVYASKIYFFVTINTLNILFCYNKYKMILYNIIC